MADLSAANRLRQAAHVATDYGDTSVTCDIRDLFEVTQEAADGRALAAALEDFLAIVDQSDGFAVDEDGYEWNVTRWQDEPAVAAARKTLARARGEGES